MLPLAPIGTLSLDPAEGTAPWNPMTMCTDPYLRIPEFTFITLSVHPAPSVSVSK